MEDAPDKHFHFVTTDAVGHAVVGVVALGLAARAYRQRSLVVGTPVSGASVGAAINDAALPHTAESDFVSQARAQAALRRKQ